MVRNGVRIAVAAATDHAGHGARDRQGHSDDDHAGAFRQRFWWSLLLTVPLVAASHPAIGWFGYRVDFPGVDGLVAALGSVIFFWAGWPFLVGGAREARAGRPGMMLLIALALTVAYLASLAHLLGRFDQEFWWELSTLVTIMLFGHWQEMKALGQAGDALAELAALLPDEAERVHDDGTIETVRRDQLALGEVVLVRPGGRVPADGEIVEGSAEFDQSVITGESRPVTRSAGDRVAAGTLALDSAIRIRITAVGENTTLGGIRRLVAEAQASRSRARALADRGAAALFYVALGAALVTFVAWSAVGRVDRAVEATVGVLVISCPHALGLAVPLVVSLSTAVAARAGILVRDRLALERMRLIDAVLFDKTGTLTEGRHAVSGVAAVGGFSDDEVVRLAAAVEASSEHPLARAIVRAATERGGVARARNFRSFTGRGVEATIEGTWYAVGGPALLRERNLVEPAPLAPAVDRWRARGATVLYLVRGGEIIGALALEDAVRPEARPAVTELRRLGKRVVMITGDARAVAEAVGADLGVDEVIAEVLPEDKVNKVVELQARGMSVAMVGDGVNDAPALVRADVGIAIGAGVDVAIESAGIILASSDPRDVVSVIRLSRAGYRKMLENLAWAAGYNLVAIPLAGGALAWAGVTLPPTVGAVLMSVSTIVVALNAQRLRRLNLKPAPAGQQERRP